MTYARGGALMTPHLGLHAHISASSVLLAGAMCSPILLLLPNQRCISTNDGMGRLLAEGFLMWWREEVMELGKVCCLTCQVLYHHWESYGILVPRPWFGIKGLIPVQWHQLWQVVHGSCSIKGTPIQLWEGFWQSSCLPRSVHQQESLTTSVKVASVGQIRPTKRKKNNPTHGILKGKIKLKKYSGRNTTEDQWHSVNSYMSSGRKLSSLRVRRP